MERIAPLAKILAEANGIEWRNLHGSGEGGLIVEGDILGYLSRIMSGEEEPPATPVDAPPPDWTGTDLLPGAGLLAPGMPSMDMLSSAGVDSDLAALVGQPQPAAPVASTLEEEALEFELEDEQAAALPSLQPGRPFAAPTFTAPSFPVPEVAAPLAAPTPDFVAPTPLLGREGQSAPLGRTAGLAATYQPEPVAAAVQDAPPPPAAPAAGGVMAGLGSLLSRLYQQPAAQPAPVPPVQPAPAPALPETPAPIPQLPEVEAPAAVPVIKALVIEAPEVEATAPEVPEPGEMAAPLPEVPATPAMVEQREVQVAEQMTAPEVDLSGPAAAAPAAPVVQPAQEDSRPREAMWLGTYLRRDANMTPAADLRRQLTAALGQDVPLALLVARAAQRHADSLGLGAVALHDLDAGRARTVQPGSLRDALSALSSDHMGTPDLLVIDAGALDLDDLHLGHTVTLSVGRVQDGRAALTLNGDVDAAQAARFLAGVAATLEEPIILVI